MGTLVHQSVWEIIPEGCADVRGRSVPWANRLAIVGLIAATVVISACDPATRRGAAIGAAAGGATGLLVGVATSVGIVPGTLIGAGVGAGAGALWVNRGRLGQSGFRPGSSGSNDTAAEATPTSQAAAQRSAFLNQAPADTVDEPTTSRTTSSQTRTASTQPTTQAPPPAYIPPTRVEVTTYGPPPPGYPAPPPYGAPPGYGPRYGAPTPIGQPVHYGAPRPAPQYGPQYGQPSYAPSCCQAQYGGVNTGGMHNMAEYVARAQAGLARLGYDPGPANNVRADLLSASIREYQRDHGLPVDGMVTAQVTHHIEAQSGRRGY